MKKKQSTFLRVMSYFKIFKWRLFFVTLFGVVGIVLYSLMPDQLNSGLAKLEAGGGLSEALMPLITYLLLCFFSEGFNFVCKFIIIRLEYRLTVKVLNDARRKLDVAPLSFIDQFEIGQTTHRIAIGRKLFQQCMATTYQVCRVMFFFVITIIWMVRLDLTLTIVVVISLPLTILVARLVARKTQRFYRRNEAIEGKIYNFTEEHSTLHGFFNENGLAGRDEFAEINQIKGSVGVDTVVGLNETYINFLTNFMYLAITVVFGMLAIKGKLSMGFAALPTFLMYSQRFLSNTKIITTATNVIQPTESIGEVFLGILDCPDDVTADEDTKIKKINGAIVFENVATDKVKDINFTIPFGSTVAFLEAENGTGTEIVELMTKLALPKEGQIKVNDLDLARIRSQDFYRRVGVCFDRPFLIDASIAENIMYGVGKTLPENVIEVTSLFGFDSFIRRLPNGYDTRLTQNTTLLTHAEQQAVNLARTVLHAPDVLIMNNALTNYDTFAEKRYNDIVIKKLTDRTRIIVTTQAKTIQNVDTIYVCQGGRIVEAGTHAELMQRKGVYYSRFVN